MGRVVGSCKEQEWKIYQIVEDWVGTIVVDVVAIAARIVAVAAFAVEAYQFAVEPTVSARKDSESHLETSFVAMG